VLRRRGNVWKKDLVDQEDPHEFRSLTLPR
jgi:hypothetical protein